MLQTNDYVVNYTIIGAFRLNILYLTHKCLVKCCFQASLQYTVPARLAFWWLTEYLTTKIQLNSKSII